MTVRILSIRPAPEGFSADAIALFSFIWEPTEHDGPVKVNRYEKPTGPGDAGKKYERFSFVGCSSVKMIDAVLMDGTKGLWVQIGDLEMPFDARRVLADMAEREARRAGILGAKPAQPGDAGSEGVEFPTGPVIRSRNPGF